MIRLRRSTPSSLSSTGANTIPIGRSRHQRFNFFRENSQCGANAAQKPLISQQHRWREQRNLRYQRAAEVWD
jgi:hypothetical protein